MQIKVTKNVGGIDGLCIIEPAVHGDARGYFMETYNKKEMEEAGIHVDFVQDNQSMSTKGVLRGLHFQKQYPQCKLVRAVRGAVFDVAVDLRADSKTYGKWYGVELTDENKKQVLFFSWIPLDLIMYQMMIDSPQIKNTTQSSPGSSHRTSARRIASIIAPRSSPWKTPYIVNAKIATRKTVFTIIFFLLCTAFPPPSFQYHAIPGPKMRASRDLPRHFCQKRSANHICNHMLLCRQ